MGTVSTKELTKEEEEANWRQDMSLAAAALLTSSQDLLSHKSKVERIMRMASPVISRRCRTLIDMMDGARALDESWLRAIQTKGQTKTTTRKRQVKGRFLAQGAAGCVFYPPLKSMVEDYSGYTDLVGKVCVSLSEATKELKESKEWVKLDPEGRFGVYPLTLVTVDPSVATEQAGGVEEAKKCTFTTDGVFENPSYQIILPKAISAAQCVDTAPHTIQALKQHLYALANLFEGFEVLNAQGLVHGDIKIDNVVCMSCKDPGAYKFIDFGFSFNVHNSPEAVNAIYALGSKPYMGWPVISTFLFKEFENGRFPRVVELWQKRRGKTFLEYVSEPYDHDEELHTIFSESKSPHFTVETWGFIRFQLERVLSRWSTEDASPEEMVLALARAVDMYSLGILLAEVWGIFNNSTATIISDKPEDVQVTLGPSAIPMSKAEHALVYTFIARLTGFHFVKDENVFMAYTDMLARLFQLSDGTRPKKRLRRT